MKNLYRKAKGESTTRIHSSTNFVGQFGRTIPNVVDGPQYSQHNASRRFLPASFVNVQPAVNTFSTTMVQSQSMRPQTVQIDNECSLGRYRSAFNNF